MATHFLNLPTELRHQVQKELPLKAPLALRQTYQLLYDEIILSFLKPVFRKTSLNSKTTFYADINHVLPCFWHLHPQGIQAYRQLKTVANDPKANPICKLYEMERIIQGDVLTAMIIVAQPTISKVAREALCTEYADGVASTGFLLFKSILKVDPEIVIFTLQSPEFKTTFLDNPYLLLNPHYAIGFLRDIALYYDINHADELEWTLNIDINTEFESTFIQLSELIVATLLDRQPTNTVCV